MPGALAGKAQEQGDGAMKRDLAEEFRERARSIVAAGPRDPLGDSVVEALEGIVAGAFRHVDPP